ncbi:MAG: hypothetical protein ABSF44_13905 [Candidatus Bathyarchaeia archaeon]
MPFYGASLFGTVLDVSTTRIALLLGASEKSLLSRYLFASIGFNATAVFKLVFFGAFIVFSDSSLRYLLRRFQKENVPFLLKLFAKVLFLGCWFAVFVYVSFTVANNLAVLQHIG